MNPLYNVIVSIPSVALDPFPTGVSCVFARTSISQPIATAMTDAKGHFRHRQRAGGTSFPLVMQLGMASSDHHPASMVTRQCATIRLRTPGQYTPATCATPRNITDATTTGSTPAYQDRHSGWTCASSDLSVTERLQCLLRRIGVDASEFTLPSSTTGSVRLYTSRRARRLQPSVGITEHFPTRRRASGIARLT